MVSFLCMHLHGEAGGADQQGVARAQRELPDILSHYRPDDILILMRQVYTTDRQ